MKCHNFKEITPKCHNFQRLYPIFKNIFNIQVKFRVFPWPINTMLWITSHNKVCLHKRKSLLGNICLSHIMTLPCPWCIWHQSSVWVILRWILNIALWMQTEWRWWDLLLNVTCNDISVIHCIWKQNGIIDRRTIQILDSLNNSVWGRTKVNFISAQYLCWYSLMSFFALWYFFSSDTKSFFIFFSRAIYWPCDPSSKSWKIFHCTENISLCYIFKDFLL